MRSLAHIEKIEWIRQIEGANSCELAGVLGWQCVTKIGEFKAGDLAVYIEIDSIVDSENPNFAFLESKKYRIKTQKMFTKLVEGGVLSQGILFPLSILPVGTYNVGDDVTKILKIKQVEDEVLLPKRDNKSYLNKLQHNRFFKTKLGKRLLKIKWFRKLALRFCVPHKKPKNFPDYVVKTNEERLQGMPWVLEAYKDKSMVVTEKCVSGRMKILTNVGELKIKDIVSKKLPVFVASYDTKNQTIEYKPILQYHKVQQNDIKKHYKIGVCLENNITKYLECTENHKLLVNGKAWERADKLVVGDEVTLVFKDFMVTNETSKVLSVEALPPKKLGEYMYDITIADNHNYFANGICVHNCDGTSTTFALKKIRRKKFDFAVCSRNVRQLDMNQKCFYDDNVYWEMAFKYNVEDILKSLQQKYNAQTVVIQGETIGEGIQKNKYNIKGHDIYVFNLIIDGKKIDSVEAKKIIESYGMKFVPILCENFALLHSIDEMLVYADGESQLAPTLREGLVIRDHDNTISFKCISNKFLIEHKL